uniref:Uncharacterized protein n=1 Tax=Oryza punctata TaxID=4537 RepID=A0A0E0KVJ2_ORYPU
MHAYACRAPWGRRRVGSCCTAGSGRLRSQSMPQSPESLTACYYYYTLSESGGGEEDDTHTWGMNYSATPRNQIILNR